MKAQTQIEYHAQTALNSISAHKAMSTASILTTTACIMLISLLFLLGQNIRLNLQQFQKDNAMLAFVSDTLSSQEAYELQPLLESVPGVNSVSFISKAEAYTAYMASYEAKHGHPDAYIEPSVFRDRFAVELTGSHPAGEVTDAISAIPGIADTRLDEVVSNGFAIIQKTLRVLGAFIAALLLTLSSTIMTNTVRLTTLARQEEIAVMKMMGAYDRFVRTPFVIEGCIIGCVGAIFAFLLSAGIYVAAGKSLISTGIFSLITAAPLKDMAATLFLIDLALGCVIGFLGSHAAIRKLLRV